MATKSTSRTDKSGRSRKITKFALAGVAVLGVGGALTSAAWTDDVFFGATASAGSVDLEGSVDGTAWSDGENPSGADIVVPASVFASMAPLEARSVTLYLRNNGQGTLNLGTPSWTGSGDLFNGGGDDIIVNAFGAYADAQLGPNETTSFTVNITAPDWGNGDQGKAGALVVNVQGTT